MERFDVLAVFAVCLVAVVTADLTTTSVANGDCVCATTNVNARNKAGLSGDVVFTIKSGECVTLRGGASKIADNYRWYKVTSRGQTLWVAGRYLSKSSAVSCLMFYVVRLPKHRLVSTRSSGSCSGVQQLACDLLNNRNLTLATAHASARSDNAFARNNLRDTCDGRQAARSSYTCSECRNPGAPGGSVCIAESVLRYLAVLVARGRVKVNEIAGACHSCSSKHYQGLAIDLDNGPKDQEFITTCNNRGGRGIDERNHIHCQFNS